MTTETKTADTQTNHVGRSTLGSPYVLVPVILALPLMALWGFSNDESAQPSVNAQSMLGASVNSNSTPTADAALTSDDTYRKLIVGNWETDRDGRRFLKVFENGTAVMDVEIPGNWSLLFGKKMKFDIVWSIEDGVLTFETTGGEPKAKVDLITSMYGKQRVQKIKILDETTLRLPDEDPGSEDHIWTRIGPADSQRL